MAHHDLAEQLPLTREHAAAGTPISPSLVARLAMMRPRPTPTSATRRAMTIALGAVLVVSTAVATGATLVAWRIDSETRRIVADGAAPGRARVEAAAVARAFSEPTLAATLAALAARLPEGVLLVGAARGRDGMLRVTIDSADPDTVRAAFAADPWLARFRARGEDRRDDGRLRVTFEEADG